MDTIKPRELRTAARVTDALVYAAGIAGIVAGALLFTSDQLPWAIVAWVLTFVAGAVLRLTSWGVRALADLLDRSERIEQRLDTLTLEPPAGRERDDERRVPDPYRRWGGFH